MNTKIETDNDLLDTFTIRIPLKSSTDGTKRRALLILPEDYSDADLKRVAKFVTALKEVEADD